jgi:hypothetical protein
MVESLSLRTRIHAKRSNRALQPLLPSRSVSARKASPGKGRWHEVPERFSFAALLRPLPALFTVSPQPLLPSRNISVREASPGKGGPAQPGFSYSRREREQIALVPALAGAPVRWTICPSDQRRTGTKMPAIRIAQQKQMSPAELRRWHEVPERFSFAALLRPLQLSLTVQSRTLCPALPQFFILVLL